MKASKMPASERVTRPAGRAAGTPRRPVTRTRPEDPAPPVRSLARLREAARVCRACPLYKFATQTVFGKGPGHAALMLVGEQPGNDEDLRGEPFVGPAGRVLDELLARAGIDRQAVYLTNAVKHFKFVQQGKRRLHQKPKGLEMKACKPWLQAEIERVQPEVVVALGAVAAASLFGSQVSVVRDRGRPIDSPLARHCFVTYHPSAALRAITPADRARIREALLADLALASKAGTGTSLRKGNEDPPSGPEIAPLARGGRRKAGRRPKNPH